MKRLWFRNQAEAFAYMRNNGLTREDAWPVKHEVWTAFGWRDEWCLEIKTSEDRMPPESVALLREWAKERLPSEEGARLFKFVLTWNDIFAVTCCSRAYRKDDCVAVAALVQWLYWLAGKGELENGAL